MPGLVVNKKSPKQGQNLFIDSSFYKNCHQEKYRNNKKPYVLMNRC